MKRRTFCSAVLGGGLAAGLSAFIPTSFSRAASVPSSPLSSPDLVAVSGENVTAAVDAGLAALGGMEAFVKPGQTVLIKPNMGWAVTPDGGANTNPVLMKRLIEHCFKAGARKVTCFDNPCDHWRDAYRESGIEAAVKDAGGVVGPPHSESYYQRVNIPDGKILVQTKIHELYMEADVVLNVPVLKHHGGAGLSCAMKNLMGAVWDRRFYHGRGLDQCIADFCLYAKQPALNIVDASRVMLSGGPRGQSYSQFRKLDLLILGRDIVATDVASALAFGAKPERFSYIGLAAGAGVGKGSLEGLNIQRLKV
jgi:uncharacterized protein (DUF362 family)